jgi:hypothetical protein
MHLKLNHGQKHRNHQIYRKARRAFRARHCLWECHTDPGGFKSERVKNDPIYDLTRKRNSEFGRCATLSSLFKRNLDFYLKLLPDPYVYNHIQKWMAAVKEYDVSSPKGEKTVGKGLLTDEGAELFRKFSFNRKRRFGFGGMSGYGIDVETGILDFSSFDTSHLSFPAGAKSVGLQLILLRVDFENADCVISCGEMMYLDKGGVFSGSLVP